MSLLINEPPLQVSPSLAVAIGLNEAIFLQQLHYWVLRSGHNIEGRRWVYNTVEGWCEQMPFISPRTMQRVLSGLKAAGLIEATCRHNRKNTDRTTWLTINYDAVEKIQSTPESANLAPSITPIWHHPSRQNGVLIESPETTREKPSAAPSSPPASSPKKSPSDHAWLTRWWCFAFAALTAEQYAFTKKAAGQIRDLLKALPLEEVVSRACVYLALAPEQRFPRGSPTLEGLQAMVNQLAGRCSQEIEDRCWKLGLLPDSAETPLRAFRPWESQGDYSQLPLH